MKQLLKKTFLYTLYRKWIDFRHELNIRPYRSNQPGDFYCIGCGRHWIAFKPFPEEWVKLLKDAGWPYSLDDAETLNYRQYTCYGCGINDRDRMYLLYLERELEKNKPIQVVEFAPTPVLSRYFKKHPNVTHRTADLFMENVNDKLDLQDLSAYQNGQFDMFICSHILEHVDDDRKAMRELYRTLKKGGTGIAMVPIINQVEKTHEDITITDPQLKLRYFGQGDHVRLYAKKDFIERLVEAGFKVRLLDSEYFGPGVFEKNAISPGSVLYIVEK